jgi:CheY-like chemotaxis protein
LTQRKKPGATAGSNPGEPPNELPAAPSGDPSAAPPGDPVAAPPPVDPALVMGSIVHDFKNVLSAIRGFATVIGEDLQPHDPAREDVEQILTAVDRGAQLAERLLAWRGRASTPRSGVPVEVTLERSTGWTLQQPKRSATILVVEDDDLVRTMTVRVLRRNGFTTIEADNASAAVERAEVHGVGVDLLLVDVGLPVTGGLELVERLKARWPSSKVLFMSAFGRTTLAEQGILPGANFLEKPFAPVTLIERIETILAPGSS